MSSDTVQIEFDSGLWAITGPGSECCNLAQEIHHANQRTVLHSMSPMVHWEHDLPRWTPASFFDTPPALEDGPDEKETPTPQPSNVRRYHRTLSAPLRFDSMFRTLCTLLCQLTSRASITIASHTRESEQCRSIWTSSFLLDTSPDGGRYEGEMPSL